MKFQGAVIKEQGQTFGIAVVKRSVLESTDRDKAQFYFASVFGVPTVLMAQDLRGRPRFYGRPDIVRFLSRIPIQAIPWREYRS
jgi:hypothetical protein